MQKRMFELSEELQKLLQCVVCQETCPGAPPVQSCIQGHLICRFCLERMRQISPGEPIKCPMCRTSLGSGENQLCRSLIGNNLLDLLPYRSCDICNKRNIPKEIFTEHLENCQRDENVTANCGIEYIPTSPRARVRQPFTITYEFEAQTSQLFEGFSPLGIPHPFRFAGRDFYLQNFASRQTGHLFTNLLLVGDRSDCQRFGIKIRITISDERSDTRVTEPTEVYNNVLRPIPITTSQQVGSALESMIVTCWNTRKFQCIDIQVKKILNLVVF